MKWYDSMISEEFVNYFCGENSKFYEICDNKVVYMPLFNKFKKTILQLTYEHINAPNGCRLSDYWKSIEIEGKSQYEVDISILNDNQIAVLIMYPFWSRMGGSFEKEFLDDGRLKKYLSALYKKANDK